jgi:hypothetical protein
MIDEEEMRHDLSRAVQALDRAVDFLDRYDAAQAALLGMAPGWQSPLNTTVRDGRLAIGRVAASVRALTGEPVGGGSLNGMAVHPLILVTHGDPGE